MELAAHEVVSPVWPAGGFAVGGAILFGYWASLSGLLGSIFLSSAHSPDVLVSIWIGLGAMVQAICGRYIALRLFRRKTFKDYTDVFITIFSSVFGAALSATICSAALLTFGEISYTGIKSNWITWWSGDAIGILMILPLFLDIRNKSYLDVTIPKILEALAMLAGMLIILYFTFTRDLDEAYLWLCCPLFILAGVRTGRFNTSVILLIISFFVASMTVKGYGPFQYGETNRSLIYVQTLIAAYSLSVLFIKQMGATQKIKYQFLLGLSLAAAILFILTSYTTFFEKKNTLDDYNRLNEEVISSLDKAEGLYDLILNGTSGLFSMSQKVTREEWKAYIGTIHLTSFFESVRGLGFISLVKKENLSQFLKQNNIGKVHHFDSKSDSGSDHYIVTYYEPTVEPHKDVIGLDIATEEHRKTAADEAKKLHKTIASGPITLFSDPSQSTAFSIYHPAYNKNKEFIGWTYAPILGNVFFGNILANYNSELKIRIRAENKVLYANTNSEFRKDDFYQKKFITIFGIPHEVEFYPTDAFFKRHSDFSVGLPFIINFLVLLITALIREQITFNIRAEKIVQERTQELDQSRMQLIESSKMASLGEMASSMAHEINNPLTIIQGKLQVINMILDDLKIYDRPLLDELRKIKTTTERIEKIVKGLRNFSRTAIHDPFEHIPLKEIINETMDLCGQKIKAEGIKLHLGQIPSVHIKCRPAQISQVLINLLNNSRDAIFNKEEKWIDVSFRTYDKKLAILVTDSGSGIPDEVAEKMMEPFFTTKEVGKGTGLGLSISKGIISNHDGKLWLDRTSRHTCFVIELDSYV